MSEKRIYIDINPQLLAIVAGSLVIGAVIGCCIGTMKTKRALRRKFKKLKGKKFACGSDAAYYKISDSVPCPSGYVSDFKYNKCCVPAEVGPVSRRR